ncbi:MAG: YraN family protein [Terriglobales bacterium]
MASGRLLKLALRSLDAAARVLPWAKCDTAAHILVARRGEEDAYFWLRRNGYVMVARNWRTPRLRGEIDLIGWDAGVLCFIEVKTRSSRDLITAEAAVDHEKQRALRAVARDYLRRLKQHPAYRFDVVTIYYDAGRPDIALIRNAFSRE